MNKANIELYSDFVNTLKEKEDIESLNILDEINKLKKIPEIKISKDGARVYNKIKKIDNEETKKILMNIFFNELNDLSWYGIFTIQVRISEIRKDIEIIDFIELHDLNNDWTEDLIEELKDKIYECSGKNIAIKLERKMKGLKRKIDRNISDNFGSILKELRNSMGLSLKELESLCGVSASYINRLEKSERKAPSIPIANDIAKVFGEEGQRLLNCINITDNEIKSFSDLIYRSNFSISNFKATVDDKEFIVKLITKIFSNNNLTKEQMDNILNNINL